MKIAFAAIVKGSDDEAPLLDRLLDSVAEHVDGIFITITQPNDAVRAVAEKYGANISDFEWVGDFSAARNFNFKQVPKEYDYIMWGDADDTFTNMQDLKKALTDVQADAYLLWYIYDRDEYGMANVVHAKTQIVRNDGSFVWKGRIHEDLDCGKEIEIYLIDDIKRLHHPTAERVAQSAERNLGIAMTEDEDDPRTWWNRSNAFLSLRKYNDAYEALNKFIGASQSDGEKYLAQIRMAQICKEGGKLHDAIKAAKEAISLHYDWPDAYFTLGEMYIATKDFYKARDAIMEGLKKKPPTYELVVYNPRDYDYNPLMLLAKCYWEMGRPKDALTCLQSCKQIQPENTSLEAMIDVAQEESDLQDAAEKAKEKLDAYKNKKTAQKFLDSLPEKLRKHALIMHWANQNFIKETSSGKDVAYFCGISHEIWNPDSIKTGIGGSEEAVILLTKEWAKKGYNVTVYTNCGEEKEYDGVLWRPWWLYNPRDKQDITVLWRSFKALDHDINSDKIYVDLHDTIAPGEMTERRLEKIDKIFVKSKAHRKLYPKVHSDKFAIVNNPMDTTLFEDKPEKDPYLIVNTSSPERSLDAVCRIFRKVKEKEPRAKMKWAYGWNGYDAMRSDEVKAMQWKDAIKEYMEVVGIEELGRISHEEVAELYKNAGIFLYPTKFYEIDCISARKAQIAGCHTITSDFAALKETNQDVTLPTTADESKWHEAHYIGGIGTDEEEDQQYVEEILRAFKEAPRYLDAEHWKPENIAQEWIDVWES